MTDLLTGDHKRGCRGREYVCTCGHDDDVVNEIARLRSALRSLLRKWPTNATEEDLRALYGTETANRVMAARAALTEASPTTPTASTSTPPGSGT